MIFKFTNVVDTQSTIKEESIKHVSPTLEIASSNAISFDIEGLIKQIKDAGSIVFYNPEITYVDDLNDSNITIVSIPIYNKGNYVTLDKGEVLELTVVDKEAIEFYLNIAIAFKNSGNFIKIEISDEPGPTPPGPTPTEDLDIDVPPEAFENGYYNIENNGFHLDYNKAYVSKITNSGETYDSMLPAYTFNGQDGLGVDKPVIASMINESLGIYVIDGVQIVEITDDGITVTDDPNYSGIKILNAEGTVDISHIIISEFKFNKDYKLKVMDDIKYTVDRYNYGYVETGALNLEVDNTYTANVDFYYRQDGESYPLLVTGTDVCSNGYENLDVNYLEFGSSINYLTIIDNAKWDAPTQEGGDPVLVEAQGCVAFKGNFYQQDLQFTLGINVE